jgi:hypothetical protein
MVPIKREGTEEGRGRARKNYGLLLLTRATTPSKATRLLVGSSSSAVFWMHNNASMRDLILEH